MVPRRHFLGSMAAVFAASGTSGLFAPPMTRSTQPQPSTLPQPRGLNWDSIVIETLPHNAAQRPPVVTGVSLQESGDLIAIVGDDHVVCLYDKQRQTYVDHLKNHTDWVRASAFSPDGTRLATAGNDRTMLIWNTGQWTSPSVIKRHPEAIFDLAFSHDGKRVATVGFDSWLRTYDCETGEALNKVACPCPDNHAVAYSEDDSWLAVGGRCGTIRVWDTENDTQVANYKTHRRRIRTLEFTSDNKIVSAGDDQIVRISDPTAPQSIRSFPRHASKLYATKLMDDGLIATAGSDNKIHIWQLADLQEVGILRGHTGTVTSLAYAQKQLVSGSYDTQVRVWTAERHASTEQRTTELSNGWNPTLK